MFCSNAVKFSTTLALLLSLAIPGLAGAWPDRPLPFPPSIQVEVEETNGKVDELTIWILGGDSPNPSGFVLGTDCEDWWIVEEYFGGYDDWTPLLIINTINYLMTGHPSEFDSWELTPSRIHFMEILDGIAQMPGCSI